MYKLFLSIRYLRARKINLVSVAGVIVGVMAMIVILSVMEGFGVELRERIRGTLSHVIVRSDFGVRNHEETIRKIKSVEHVVAAAPYVETLALIQAGGNSTWAMVRGVEPDAEASIGDFEQYCLKFLAVTEGSDAGMIFILKPDKVMVMGRHRDGEDSSEDIGLDDELASERQAEIFCRKGRFYIKSLDGRATTRLNGKELSGETPLQHADTIQVGTTTLVLRDSFELFKQSVRELDEKVGLSGGRTSGNGTESSPKSDETADAPASDETVPEEPEKTPGDRADIPDAPEVGTPGTPGPQEPHSGQDDLAPDALGADEDFPAPPVLLGTALLEFLPPDSVIQLVAPSGFMDFQPMEFRMAGRFKTGNYENDSRSIYVPLRQAQDLVGYLDKVSGISVCLADYRLADQAVERLQAALGPGFVVETWEKQREILLKAIDNERRVMAVVLLFITIVAGFCIMATLWMMVTEKTKDIGILKSIGGTVGGIMGIFLLNGTLIGIVGAVIGVVAGLGFLEIMNPLADWVYLKFGWHVFPPTLYYLDHIPASKDPAAIMLIALSAVGISFLAALYPALKAARLDPVEALRYE